MIAEFLLKTQPCYTTLMRYFIDVREPEEYNENHVKGAINIPPASLMNGAPELFDVPKDSEIIVYCRSGARSNSAIPYLKQLGFTDIVNGINQLHVEAHYS
jgi:rhodanese-related sulfurtransferase